VSAAVAEEKSNGLQKKPHSSGTLQSCLKKNCLTKKNKEFQPHKTKKALQNSN
jgi:hypothetical protein